MRIQSLQESLSYFPDVDGFWRLGHWTESEARIRSRLSPNWMTEKTAENVELLSQLARAQGLQGSLPQAKATLESARQILAELKDEPRAKLRYLLEHGRLLCLGMNPAKAHDSFVQAWTLANETKHTFFAIDAALMLSAVRPPKFQNEWLQNALSLAQNAQDRDSKLWLDHLYMLNGWHEFDFRHYEKALASFERALEESLNSSEESHTFPYLWSKARVLRALGRNEDALTIQNNLRDRMSQIGKVNGHVFLEIAECEQLLHHQDEARSNFELAYSELSADSWFADNREEDLSRMKYISKKH